MLIKHYKIDVMPLVRGKTPLHSATMNGTEQSVRLLLEAGADPNVHLYDSQNTPLHLAITRERLCDDHSLGAVVDMLLKAGADPNASNASNWTPTHDASGKKSWFFSAKKPEISLLLGYGAADILKKLLDHGGDVRARNIYGQTPMDLTRSKECIRLMQQRLRWRECKRRKVVHQSTVTIL